MAHPLDFFKGSDAELFAQICGAQELAFKEGELTRKQKLLIALAIDVAKNAENGIRSLALQAMEHGATKKEILETLRIVNHICGAGCMYTAAAALKDVLK
jgi:alkylhydroperoxidase/carboxymuconolactone decarboxylase family protein YurZ